MRARGGGELASLTLGRAREFVASAARLVVLARPARPAGQPPGTVGAHAHPSGSLELRLAAPADGASYARDIGTDSPLSFGRRLSPATGCFLVLDGGRIVHATWITRSAVWTRELRRYVAPPPGDAYVYESFTHADARGRGLYPCALRALCAQLATQEVRTVWVAVESDNLPSLRAVTKAGFEEAAQIPYRRTLGRVLVNPSERPPGDAGDGSLRLARSLEDLA
ncbi:MAG: N-acetyltransferase family protein [Actinomycetota bacterium]